MSVPHFCNDVPVSNDGFAVLKLRAGNLHAHPMAFSFPRRTDRALFFPTLHIHDGEAHLAAWWRWFLISQEKPSDFRITPI